MCASVVVTRCVGALERQATADFVCAVQGLLLFITSQPHTHLLVQADGCRLWHVQQQNCGAVRRQPARCVWVQLHGIRLLPHWRLCWCRCHWPIRVAAGVAVKRNPQQQNSDHDLEESFEGVC